MNKILLVSLLVLFFAARSPAQQSGVLNAQATTTCAAPGNAYVAVPLAQTMGGVTLAVTANASGNTVSFFASTDAPATVPTNWFALNATPSNGTTAVTSTSSTGSWQANVAGYTFVCMEISTATSGTATVRIQPSTASARSGGGGSGTTSGQAANAIPLNTNGTATAINANVGASPAGPGTFYVEYAPTSATPVAPSIVQVGLTPDQAAGATVLYSDNNNVIYNPAAALALPTPTTLGNANFFTTIVNNGSASTITPATWTISLNGAAAGATAVVPTKSKCSLVIDQVASTQWDLDCTTIGAVSSAFNAITSGTNTTAAMVVGTGASLAFTGSSTLDMSADTAATAFKVPVGAGFTSSANGVINYDSTAGNTHVRTNAADSLAVAEASAIAAGFLPMATDATHGLLTATLCDQGITTANTLTCTNTAGLKVVNLQTGTSPPSCTPGTGGAWCGNEGTIPSPGPASAVDIAWDDSTGHCIHGNYNNTDFGCLAGLTPAQTFAALITFTTGTAAPLYEAGTSATSNIFQGGVDAAASSTLGSTTLRGADNSQANASAVAGSTTVRGGDATGATTNTTAGGLTIRGGNAASTGTPVPGAITITGGGLTAAATNVAGANVTVAGGLGTGNAAPSHVILKQPAFVSASGTGAQANVTRYVTHSKAGSTSSATPTNMFNIALANNQTAGVQVVVHVETTQATPQNCSTTEVFYAAVQETSGTVTQQTTAGTIGTICSTGTLTLAAAFSTAAPTVFSVTPSWSTIVPTAVIITIEVTNLSQQDVALL